MTSTVSTYDALQALPLPTKLLVVILNYRTPNMTLAAARATAKALLALPKGCEAEIMIVENGSGDGAPEALRKGLASWQGPHRPRLKVLPKNIGFGRGMNAGLMETLSNGTRPDLFYLQNSDAFPQDDALAELITFLRATPKAGFAGSALVGSEGDLQETAFQFPTALGELEQTAAIGPLSRLLRSWRIPQDLPQTAQQVDWTAGASLMLRRQMLEEIGGFDPDFFLYFEETELCHRARAAGWQGYFVPQSVVTHIGSVSTGRKDWARLPQYWLTSHYLYHRKTGGLSQLLRVSAARALGYGLNRLRCALSRRPCSAPPRAARDLLAHHARAVLRDLATTPTPASEPQNHPFGPHRHNRATAQATASLTTLFQEDQQ